MSGRASAPAPPRHTPLTELKRRRLEPTQNPVLHPQGGLPHSGPAHILVVFQKDKEVVVLPQGGVGCQALQKDFMHRNRLLKDSQVLPAEHSRQLKGPPGF